MSKTFSLRRLSTRHALSLFVLPALLWTGMLATVHHQAHAVASVTLSVYATGHVKKESVRVSYNQICTSSNAGVSCKISSQCLSFSPNKWSPPSSLHGNIHDLDELTLYPGSTNCSSTHGYVTRIGPSDGPIGLNTTKFNSGKACTFDYRRNLLSGCVKPAHHYKTSSYQQL